MKKIERVEKTSKVQSTKKHEINLIIGLQVRPYKRIKLAVFDINILLRF